MRAQAGLCLLLGLAACDPRDFDQAVAKAPVRSIGVPDGYQASDIGRTILSLPVPAGLPALTGRLLVAGAEKPSLALIDFDSTGHIKNRLPTGPSVADLFFDKGAPIGSAVLLRDGKILLGTPNFGVTTLNPPLGRTLLLEIGMGADGAPTFTMTR